MIVNEGELFFPSYDILSKALSMLGQSPAGHGCIFRKFSLPGQGISDVRFLKNYPALEYLELPCNSISDVSVLSHLPFLYSVDLSSNRIATFNLPPSVHLNLQHIDLSRNLLTSITELGVHAFLKHLCLDHNSIKQIDGLMNCSLLTHLSLAHNELTSLSGLAGLPIKYLDVSWNRIQDISETEFLPELEHLVLHHNEVTALIPLSTKCHHLSHLDISFNRLSTIHDLSHLTLFLSLSSLSILENPFLEVSKDQMRGFIVFQLPHLTIVDGLPCSEKEKVNAKNLFHPSTSIVAALKHSNETKEELERWAIVETEVTCNYKPLVLVEPLSLYPTSSSFCFAQRLIRDFPHVFAKAIPHTTRPPQANELHGVDFYFVSNFTMKQLHQDKKFITYTQDGKYQTGLSIEACRRPSVEGKIGIFTVTMEEAIALDRSEIFYARYLFLSPAFTKPFPPSIESKLSSLVSTSMDPLLLKSRRLNDPEAINLCLKYWLHKTKSSTLNTFVPFFSKPFFEGVLLHLEFESCYLLLKEIALKEVVMKTQEKYDEESNLES